MVNKITFKQYLLEAEENILRAKSKLDLRRSIVDGHFTKDGSKLKVTGDFKCNNTSLVSLVGLPQKIKWNFDCRNTQITSLVGGPKQVGGSFECSHLPELTSLKGAPETIDGNFKCTNNAKLTSLVGLPNVMGGAFDCGDNAELASLIGGPQRVLTWFNCSKNPQLESLEGAPQYIRSDFYCNDNPKLTSLARINFYIHAIGEQAHFTGCPIKSNILGLLKISGLKKVYFDDKKLQQIINKYLPMGDSTDCIDDLLDAGYSKEYCKW